MCIALFLAVILVYMILARPVRQPGPPADHHAVAAAVGGGRVRRRCS
jgi:hypothetical protein